MIGIVLVTHGALGREMLRTTEGIVGPLSQILAVAVEMHDGMDEIRDKMEKAIAEVDTGEGVLVLVDMFGGTPANLALTFLEERRVEVVTGVNLPMMLKLGTSRDDPSTLAEIAAGLAEYGQRNIVFASELLGARREGAPTKGLS